MNGEQPNDKHYLVWIPWEEPDVCDCYIHFLFFIYYRGLALGCDPSDTQEDKCNTANQPDVNKVKATPSPPNQHCWFITALCGLIPREVSEGQASNLHNFILRKGCTIYKMIQCSGLTFFTSVPHNLCTHKKYVCWWFYACFNFNCLKINKQNFRTPVNRMKRFNLIRQIFVVHVRTK